jgi:hypothetical protein
LASVSRLTATASRIFAGDDPITSTSSRPQAAATANLEPEETEETTARLSPENTGNSAVGSAYSDDHLMFVIVSSGMMALAVMGGGFLGLGL